MARVLVCLLLHLVAGAGFAAAQAPPGRILVVPFENVQRELRAHWLGEASAVLLSDALNARGMGAITRAERVRAFEELHLPPSATLSRATVIRIGQMVGASEVVLGQFHLVDDELSVTVQSVRLDVGRLKPNVTEQGPLTELFDMFDTLAQRVTQVAPGGGPGAGDPRPPLEAFENYIKGLVAESPAAQATFLETALKQHRTYDRARLALWQVRTDQGDHAAALAVVKAIASDSRFDARGRFAGAISNMELAEYDEAFETLLALVQDAPVPPLGSGVKPAASLFNNLGVVQLRRGATPQTGLATYYLTQAADADPGDPDFLFNLGYAYVIEKNPKAAIYWLREAVRRNPVDAEAHLVLAAALQATGSPVEASRERALALRLSTLTGDLEKQAAVEKLPVPRGLERVRTELDAPRSMRPEQTIVNTAQREQQDLATFHLDQGRRHFDREEDREAMIELRRAVYLSPYEAEAHLLIGRMHLRGGRPQDAVDTLKLSIWSADSAAARIALAEAYLRVGSPNDARPELERALALDPDSVEAKKLLEELGKGKG
ncbi:MAG: tetratricopeptide repeat protein [Acidobacteria bacterium]|nr:tetratricopeptide repeat protein [Acidobacteriota bacterium]MBA3885565.1 tetratricopeptide repeat protein [Acidobacteriota bacterium]